MLCLFLALEKYKTTKKILIIANHFPQVNQIINTCYELNIFEVIYKINDHDNDALKHWSRRYRMFFFYKGLTEILQKYICDKVLFFPGEMLVNSFIIKIVKSVNPNCEFSLVEDGIGSYLGNTLYEPNNKASFWLKLLKRDKYLKDIKYLYLLKPELLNFCSNYKIIKIDGCILKNQKLKEVLNRVFVPAKLPECDILMLQQPIKQDNKKYKDIDDRQFFLFDKIGKQFKNHSIYIKYHPRTKILPVVSNCKSIPAGVLFENALTPSINNSIIISVYSTAAFTPYFLGEYTPPLIFLYKICKFDDISVSFTSFVENFAKLYSKVGGVVLIPNSIDELISSIESVFSQRTTSNYYVKEQE